MGSSVSSSSASSNAFFSSSLQSGSGDYNEEGYYTGSYTSTDQSSPAFKVVKNKLTNAKTFEKLNFTTSDQEDQLTFSLCNSVAFKNRYLKLNCVDHNAHMGAKINEDMHNLKDEDFESLSEEERHRIYERILHHRRNARTLNVKLFVNKIAASDNGFIRHLANSAGFEFGAFHVGLDIGGVILEWGRGLGGRSLVVPSVDVDNFLVYARVNFDEVFPGYGLDRLRFITRHPIEFGTRLFRALRDMSIRLLTFGEISNDQLDKVASKCVYYNTTLNYNLLKRNCQDFIKDILGELDMQFNPQGEFKVFLDRVTQCGNNEFIFKGDKFNSRSELENYADHHWESLEEWDRRLLVCYCDLMDHNYQQTQNPKWGPIDGKKWKIRINGLSDKPSKGSTLKPD